MRLPGTRLGINRAGEIPDFKLRHYRPGGTGGAGCCARVFNATMYASIPGNPTATLTWNGTHNVGSKALTCGETLFLRFDPATCGLEYSCDNITWLPSVADLITQVCLPTFSMNFTSVDLNTGTAGCNTAGCGTLTITVTE